MNIATPPPPPDTKRDVHVTYNEAITRGKSNLHCHPACLSMGTDQQRDVHLKVACNAGIMYNKVHAPLPPEHRLQRKGSL